MRTLILALAVGSLAGPARIELVWPTSNPAAQEGRPLEAFIQPTASRDPVSGTFGCVRSNGFQFHEGLDLLPLRRDARGEPLDEVKAAMDGVVRHVNTRSGESSYGRYIVLEHPGATPAIYTLYAHLHSIAPGLAVGDEVKGGQMIAVMGHTAGGYAIPRDRAHLHFEMGLVVTRDFQRWYDHQRFGSPNEHGMWNGMNLMGFDPLDFARQYWAHRVDNVIDYLRAQPVAVRVRVASNQVPDFVRRYPSLLKGTLPTGPVAGWEVECMWTGLPLSLRPLTSAELGGLRPGGVQIVEVNQNEIVQHRAISLLRRGTRHVPGRALVEVLDQLFALR